MSKAQSISKRCFAMCEAEAIALDLPQGVSKDIYILYWSLNGNLDSFLIVNLSDALAKKYSVKPYQVMALLNKIIETINRYNVLLNRELQGLL